jgi:hypothetical protein
VPQRALGLPGTRAALRALGATELAIGLAGVVIGGPAATVVAVAYRRADRRRAPVVAARPTRRAVASAHPRRRERRPCGRQCRQPVAAAVAAFGPRPFTVIADQPLAGVPFLVLVALAAGLAALVADSLPALRATVRRGF